MLSTEALVAKYKAENDPHREIQAQALADRIVSFAEAVHKEIDGEFESGTVSLSSCNASYVVM